MTISRKILPESRYERQRGRHLFSLELTLLLSVLVLFPSVQSFEFLKPLRRSKPLNVVPLTEDKVSSSLSPPYSQKDDGDNDEATTATTISSENQESSTASTLMMPLLDPSGSIGSLLLQMQKREEEMRKLNKTLLDEDQALDLSLNTTKLKATTRDSQVQDSMADDEAGTDQRDKQQNLKDDLFSWMLPKLEEVVDLSDGADKTNQIMNVEAAKELDASVQVRLTSSIKDTTVLELPELYQELMTPEAGSETTAVEEGETETDKKTRARFNAKVARILLDELPPLSRKDHYEGQIGKDMRRLAVSIASCVDDVSEWRLFCQQATGGIMPLVECIRDAADSIRQGDAKASNSNNYLMSPTGTGGITVQYDEETFEIASSACRALRDLCALSLDLAAVITDGLLRANTAYEKNRSPTLMDDLCMLLRHTDDVADLVNARSRKRHLVSKLHISQLLLAMTCASDSAVDAIRGTSGLRDVLLASSSYARKERRRRWLRYPGELIKSVIISKSKRATSNRRRPFIEATSLTNDLNGKIQGTSNQVLAAIGYNEWVPKIPGQKGLRILCLDGGGSRGMTSAVALKCLVDALGGVEVADCFDLVVGTSTGAIIAFLVGLNRETSEQAVERYDVLIEKIFTKSAFSTPMLLFTTASYDELPFMKVLSDILGDNTMLDSRADPAVPFVFGVTSKMSSTPTHVALFRNYNYNGNELPDPFMIDPNDARNNLGLPLENEVESIRTSDYPRKKEVTTGTPGSRNPQEGSRNPGSFRVLQRYALRASTAAPTVFKPVMMGGEMYADGGIVASNPTAIAIHEARMIFPDVPIELVLSFGTGGFLEQKSEPRIGWDGIISQIVNSATDGEQIHHILEDILGDGGTTAQIGRSHVSNTRYMRFNPILGLPDEFPIDVTDPEKLTRIKTITREYMQEPQQKRKLQEIADLLQGRKKRRFKVLPSRWFR